MVQRKKQERMVTVLMGVLPLNRFQPRGTNSRTFSRPWHSARGQFPSRAETPVHEQILVFTPAGNGRRHARSLIDSVCISRWQSCTGSVVQVGVAGLRLGVLVFADVRVSGNFVRFGVVVVGHVECGLFLSIGKRLLDVVVDLLV